MIGEAVLVRWCTDCRRNPPTAGRQGDPLPRGRPPGHTESRATDTTAGEFDLGNPQALRQTLAAALVAGHRVTVDFSAVTFIDAAVVGVLVQCARLAAEHDIELSIAETTGQPKLVLAMTAPVA